MARKYHLEGFLSVHDYNPCSYCALLVLLSFFQDAAPLAYDPPLPIVIPCSSFPHVKICCIQSSLNPFCGPNFTGNPTRQKNDNPKFMANQNWNQLHMSIDWFFHVSNHYFWAQTSQTTKPYLHHNMFFSGHVKAAKLLEKILDKSAAISRIPRDLQVWPGAPGTMIGRCVVFQLETSTAGMSQQAVHFITGGITSLFGMNICAALWSLKCFQRLSIRIWTHPTLDVLGTALQQRYPRQELVIPLNNRKKLGVSVT